MIGTLPTFIDDSSFLLASRMLSHPAISSVRYNTGGDSPFTPTQIVSRLKALTVRYGKPVFIDLEGRQVRIAHWARFESGVVTLNRDFTLTLPAQIFIRNAGWFEVGGFDSKQRKIYLGKGPDLGEYYFGESQSVHILSPGLKIKGYLGGLDDEYIKMGKQFEIVNFMLSFVEGRGDVNEFKSRFTKKERQRLNLVLKIESQKGLEFAKSRDLLANERLMAARDDLFASFGSRPAGIVDALTAIIGADPKAILASKIMSGLQSAGALTMGDISDIFLMYNLGYRDFMLSDGMARHFDEAVAAWKQFFRLTYA